MAVSLYRRYRPMVFADVVGQESVTRGLLSSLKTDGVSHAYLFTGPRGSGKTTTARLLAKSVNCTAPADGEPCNSCQPCSMANEGRFLDLVELDAASNRGIDEIRHLREQVAFAPAMGKYRTYILDEVHMLTKDAANAFLKTLEEPPAHVIFILATTEAHKVMGTISSRCQLHDFQRIPTAAATGRLQQVIAAEGLKKIDPAALEEIVLRGDGSLRDMLGLLEQVLSSSGSGFGVDDVRTALGLAKSRQVADLGQGLLQRQAGAVLATLADFHDQGIEPQTVLNQLLEWFREQLGHRVRTGARKSQAEQESLERLIAILGRLSSLVPRVRQALVPRMTLEIGLLEASYSELFQEQEALRDQIDRLSRQVAELAASGGSRPGASLPEAAGAEPARLEAGREVSRETPPARPRLQSVPAEPPKPVRSEPVEASEPPPIESEVDSSPSQPVASNAWADVLERIRRESPQTHAFAVEVLEAELQGKRLKILFSAEHAFHRSRLEEPKHRSLLSKFAKEVYGTGISLHLEEKGSKGAGKKQERAPVPDRNWAEKRLVEDETVKLIVDSFGGQVVRWE